MLEPGAGVPVLWPAVIFPRDPISIFSFTQCPEVPLASGFLSFPVRIGRWERAHRPREREQGEPKFTLESGSFKL